MNYRVIEMGAYARRDHFEYFKDMAYPYVGVTVNVDITDFHRKTAEEKYPFFLSFLYLAANAANSVPELRQRIDRGGIIEYPNCPTSHTVALEDGTYCYCTLSSDMPFEDYLAHSVLAQENAKKQQCLEDGEDALSLFFISSLPWLTYEAIIQPVPSPADSNPRITWGRFHKQDGRLLMPVSILCHHALVDGLHLSRFYKALDAGLSLFASKEFSGKRRLYD